MPAQISDKLTQTTVNSRPVPTTVTSTRAGAGTTLSCLALTGWPTATAVHFITYKINTSNQKVAGSQIDWKGIVSGTTLTSLTLMAGTDSGNAVGDIVEAAPTAAYANDLYTWGTTEHTSAGTHAAITATSITDAGTLLSNERLETYFDHVNAGCVWSGDSYGGSLNGSMASGVVYIGGKRIVVASITAHAFTASKDTYVYVDNTGLVTYNANTTNTISPALPANSLLLAIIVSGANIATATSINQGQETMVVPIVSSIAYSITDGLGNLICPRDPNRRILGYRQLILSPTGTTQADLTGLAFTCNVPTSRKIRLLVSHSGMSTSGTAGTTNLIYIMEGSTVLGRGQYTVPAASYNVPFPVEVVLTPSAGVHTYKVQANTTSGTYTILADATYPLAFKAELV